MPSVMFQTLLMPDTSQQGLKRRFIETAALSLPLLLPLPDYTWLQALLAAVVVGWGGAPFFMQAFSQLGKRRFGYLTLIAAGSVAIYLANLVRLILGHETYMASAALVIVFALFEQRMMWRVWQQAAAKAVQTGMTIPDVRLLETLAQCDILALDKTGTLTEGTPTLLSVMPSEGYTEPNLLRMAASLARYSEHPLDAAIVEGAKNRGLGFLEVHASKTVPGKGITGIMDGRPTGVGNAALMKILGAPVLKTKAEPYRSQGQIVTFVAIDDKAAGFFTIADPIRASVHATLKQLRETGLRLMLISGDSKSTAISISRKLGIDLVEAEIPPEQKADVVSSLQAKGHRVAVAGRNECDTLLLKQADVALVLSGNYPAGMTLPGGDLTMIVRARRLGLHAAHTIVRNRRITTGYMVISIAVAVFNAPYTMVIVTALTVLTGIAVIANSLRDQNNPL